MNPIDLSQHWTLKFIRFVGCSTHKVKTTCDYGRKLVTAVTLLVLASVLAWVVGFGVASGILRWAMLYYHGLAVFPYLADPKDLHTYVLYDLSLLDGISFFYSVALAALFFVFLFGLAVFALYLLHVWYKRFFKRQKEQGFDESQDFKSRPPSATRILIDSWINKYCQPVILRHKETE